MATPASATEVLAVIPARSGSKEIADKNIRVLAGKPLLAHSIGHALASSSVSRVIVSTDSPVYAEIARSYGAETPFLRPEEFAQDTSTDLEVFLHALTWLSTNQRYVPDICLHLRPTSPVRKPSDIETVIEILRDRPEIDSVRSVSCSPETPFKMWLRSPEGFISPVIHSDIPDAYNLPRQILPTVFLQNACIDAVRTNVITSQKSMTGKNIYGYVMDDSFDIDTEQDLRETEIYVSQNGSNTPEAALPLGSSETGCSTYCFDIDGVIASIEANNEYDRAAPIAENISLINSLYTQGHRILLFTARGSVTGIDWKDLTEKQMNEWGVKYHSLEFGKPAADYYVDDRLLSIDQLKTRVVG